MTVDLERLSGEELLLLRVLHRSAAIPAIDRELDRRAVSGPIAEPSRRRRKALAVAVCQSTHRAA